MALADMTGFIAAVLATASFWPQVWQSYRTRDVSGTFLSMYRMFTLGVALWSVHDLMTRAWPVVIANAVTLLLASCILGMKLQSLRQGPKI